MHFYYGTTEVVRSGSISISFYYRLIIEVNALLWHFQECIMDIH